MSQRNRIFYLIKPLIPRRMQIYLRRKLVQYQARKCGEVWPIDAGACAAPEAWPGWPEGKRFALVLTHDVDTFRGLERSRSLADLELRMGFRSSFNIVPLRYPVAEEILLSLRSRGFEIGVHGLYHDGRYYESRSVFRDRAEKINHYLKRWECSGYRAPCMLHKLDWFHDLNVEYDASTFDTDPFEPNPCGAGTIFPFIVSCEAPDRRYVELPYTLPQDFTLFVLLRQKNTDIWKRKLDWIVRHRGLVLLNTHPDYMNFDGTRIGNEEYPSRYYEQFLRHIRTEYDGQYWHVLPRDLARFWLRSVRDESHDRRAVTRLLQKSTAELRTTGQTS